MTQAYRHKTTSVSLINDHSVWCPKYRGQVVGGTVNTRLETLIRQVAAELDCEILAPAVMADHVHLFLSCPPTLAPCQIVFRVKGCASRKLRQEFPRLRRLPSLWTRSYLVGTAGNVSADTIRHTIEMQNERAWEMATQSLTYVCKIKNLEQVGDALDSTGVACAKLWNVALYHTRQVWHETGRILSVFDTQKVAKSSCSYPIYNI